MTKKEIILMVIMFALIFGMLAFLLFFMINRETTTPLPNSGNTELPATQLGPHKDSIDTETNNTVIKTNNETKIRIINKMDSSMLSAKKNLLIMFASWCPSCQVEILEIESIINHYKEDKDVNVIVIAHEFNKDDYPLSGLITLLEENVNYGDFEVFVDFGRIIRKTIDKDANTIPISYVVDKNGNILQKHEQTLTLEKAQEMLK